MKKWMVWSLAILVVALASIILVLRITVLRSGTAQKAVATATIPTAAPMTITEMQNQLVNPKLDPASRAKLSESIQIAQKETQDAEAGLSAPAEKTPQPPPRQAAPDLIRVTPGISDGSRGMVKPGEANIINNWHGMLDGRITAALAGSKPDDSNAGLLVVISMSADPSVNDTQVNFYDAPAGAGALTVTAEQDGVVTLSGTNGQTITFDLRSRAFSH